jgi:hypothetical protein
MLSMAAAFLRSAAANGWHDQDPASVKEVLSTLAGIVDEKKAGPGG